MNKYQLFESMCRSMTEASAALSTIGQSQPGAKDLIQYLHSSERSRQLSHDQPFDQVEKIGWNEFKKTWPYNFAIVTGPSGSGAIISTGNGSYEVVLSDGTNPLREMYVSTSGKAMALIKSVIGGTPAKWQYYVGQESWNGVTRTGKDQYKKPDSAHNKQYSRKRNVAKSTSSSMTTQQLFRKFRPIFAKSIIAAIADTKGMVTTMIKNDAFGRAKNKIEQLNRLDNLLQTVNSDDNVSLNNDDTLMNAVRDAVVMTASHFYPELTGEINRRGGYGYNAPTLTSTNSEGVNKVLTDVGQGDGQKLATILAFFKRRLIAS
jgi:hypothetical protein